MNSEATSVNTHSVIASTADHRAGGPFAWRSVVTLPPTAGSA